MQMAEVTMLTVICSTLSFSCHSPFHVVVVFINTQDKPKQPAIFDSLKIEEFKPISKQISPQIHKTESNFFG